MQEEIEYSVYWRSDGEEVEGYTLVHGDVEVTPTQMSGVRNTSTTLQSNVRLAYSIKGSNADVEASSRKLYDLLLAVSLKVGVWDAFGDEDIPGSDGD